MIEIASLIVVGIVVWTVAAEGIWGAAQTFLCTLFSALVAMNFFEPLAIQLKAFLPEAYTDFVALVGLFTVLVFASRLGAEQLAPSYIQVIPELDTFGRWVFSVMTGYLTMAFLMTSLHTAPLPREFLGFKPENNNLFGLAPDRQWLGFVQYVSDKSLGWSVRQKVGPLEVNPYAFDSHVEKVGDPANQKLYSIRDSYGRDVPLVIWPSFPIRYATRRDRLSSSQTSATPAEAPLVLPPAGGGPAKPSSQNPGF
jgi:hypothetical protein